MTDPVFLARQRLGELSPGNEYELTGAEARHAVVVRRIRSGERIELVDGEGTRVRGSVAATGANPPSLTLTVAAVESEPPPTPELILVQALGKGGRDEAAIEAATELGVDGVAAWQSERCVSRWDAAKTTKGIARWESILAAAAKQSRRARFPRMLGFAAGGAIHSARGPLAEALAADARIFVLHESAQTALTGLDLDGHDPRRPVVVVVGPEGGLTEAELSSWAGAGGEIVLLGRHVLRTSTAGPAALALLNARLGRW